MKPELEGRYVEYVTSKLPWLRQVAYLLCQDWHQADDVVQAAITKLYVHWPRVSGTENVDGYVRVIVVRTFLSERRSGWARRVDLSAWPPDPVAVPAPDPATRLTVRRALAQVPPRQRATLVLRFYCDLSVEETAAALRCSSGTVKSQTKRGLDALRRALGVPETTALTAGEELVR